MSSTTRPRYVCRLSPNEEASALHKQRTERRKARLLQVRRQEKEFAKSLRDEVKSKREQERLAIQEHLDVALIASHEDELRELESHYISRMGQMGKGHSDAQHINDEHNRVQELRLLLEAEQRWRAEERHKSAMKELTSNKLVEKEARQYSLKSRKRALEVEKKRAKHVATNKPHPTQPLIMDLVVGKGRRVHLKEAEGYASTYYHIPDTVVRRVDSPDWDNRPNASEMAAAKTEEGEIIQRHLVASHQEQLEKARLRHKHALAKVKLEKEKEDVLTQLKTLERQDRTHRQKSLAKMPVNLFQPAHRRGEIISEQERDMEQAFERLFVKTHGRQSQSQLSLSQLSSETTHEHSLESLDSSGEGDHQTSTAVNNADKLAQPHHSRIGGSKSPVIVPHADESNLRPVKKQAATTSPDLYDSNYSSTSPSLTTPTDHTSSSSGESSGSHSFRFPPSSSSALLPMSYPPIQTSPRHQQPSDPNLEDSDDETITTERTRDYTGHRQPTVTFSLAPTTSAPSGSPDTHIPSTQYTNMPVRSQHPPFISTSLPPPPDLSITAMTSLNTQESSFDPSRNASIAETDHHPMSMQAPPGSMSPDPQHLEPTREGRGASDGMQKLVSMIRTQHQEWNKRLVARSNLLSSQRASSSSSSSSLSPSSSTFHPLSQVHTAPLQTTNDESKANQDVSLSVFTLSTRDSTVSPQDLSLPHRSPQPPSPPSHVAVTSSLPHAHSNDISSSTTSTSPDPLSISPYHTTLEMSSTALPPPPPWTEPDTQLDQHQYESQSRLLPPSQYSVSTVGHSNTATSMTHPTLFTHTPEYTVGRLQSSINTRVNSQPGMDTHVEDIEATTSMSLPYTSPNVSVHVQPTLSPIHEETSQDLANLPSVTTMPSLSYLELPSHLSAPDVRPPPRQPSANTMDARVLLSPSDLDLTVSTNPPSPSQASPQSQISPQPSNSTMSHSTPPHSRSSSPQLLSPHHTPMSPVIRESAPSFDQQRLHLRATELGANELSANVHEHEVDSSGQTVPQQLLTLRSQGENEQELQNLNRHSSDRQAHLDSKEQLLQEATPHARGHTNTQALSFTSVATTIPSEPIKDTTATSNTSLSLQEAFLKKKEEFVQRSRARLQQLKTAAEKRQSETAPVFNVRGAQKQKVSKNQVSSSSTLGKVVGSESTGNGGRKKAVTFSSPLFHQLKPQGSNHPPVLSSLKREKIHKKEMRERNMRFYNRLPEVKRQREEEERHQIYTANREKAKQYQQRIRSKAMSKQPSEVPHSRKIEAPSQDNKHSRKPPFR